MNVARALEHAELLDELICIILSPRPEHEPNWARGIPAWRYTRRYQFWYDWYKNFSVEELRDIIRVEQDILDMDIGN